MAELMNDSTDFFLLSSGIKSTDCRSLSRQSGGLKVQIHDFAPLSRGRFALIGRISLSVPTIITRSKNEFNRKSAEFTGNLFYRSARNTHLLLRLTVGRCNHDQVNISIRCGQVRVDALQLCAHLRT